MKSAGSARCHDRWRAEREHRGSAGRARCCVALAQCDPRPGRWGCGVAGCEVAAAAVATVSKPPEAAVANMLRREIASMASSVSYKNSAKQCRMGVLLSIAFNADFAAQRRADR